MKKYITFTVVFAVSFIIVNLVMAGKMPRHDRKVYDKVTTPFEVSYDEKILNAYKEYAKDYKNKELENCLDKPKFCHGNIESLLSRVSENKMVFVPIKKDKDNYYVLIKGYTKEGFVIEDGIKNEVTTVSYEAFREMWHSDEFYEKVYYYTKKAALPLFLFR